jgi:hypothetical protein
MSSSIATPEVDMPVGPSAAITFGHPLPNLLQLSAGEILHAYRKSQTEEFTNVLRQVRGCADLTSEIPLLKDYLAHFRAEGLRRRLSTGVLEDLFLHMHEHVMAHPVWEHPFFVRVAAANVNSAQLQCFAGQYFNQVKNTRQCVALALGRFHTMNRHPDGALSIVLSELTQMVLAGLLADEYGSAAGDRGDHSERLGKSSPAVDIRELFSHVTHPELYRRFQRALGGTARDFDVPMLHGVADNVLVQRILSGHPAFDQLEALASVGLGMEWGVPAFFSMIMAGIIKVARREGLTLDARSMEIWSAHVRQDVEHAIAVMIVTSFYVENASDVSRIENATNILMAFRYNMMSEIYREVFSEPCADIGAIPLVSRHFVHDGRIEALLAAERGGLHPESVRDREAYVGRRIVLPVRRSDAV